MTTGALTWVLDEKLKEGEGVVYLIDGLASSLCLRNRNSNFPLDKLKMTFKGGEPLQEREHRGEKMNEN